MKYCSHIILAKGCNHKIVVVIMSIALMSSIGMSKPSWAAKFVVNDAGMDCPESLTATYTTIQAAVTAAIADTADTQDEIYICPGTYQENILIENAPGQMIALKGADDDRTAAVINGVANTPGPLIDVRGVDKVTIQSLTVDGRSSLQIGPFTEMWGIRFEETHGLIQNVVVKNIGDVGGSAQSLAIQIQGVKADHCDPTMPPEEKKVKVLGNFIQNFTRVGVLVDGEGAYANIEGNVLEGPTTPTTWAPNGIQFSRGAKGHAYNNYFHHMLSPDPLNGAGSGIALHCVKAVHAYNNAISDTDLGIVVIDSQENTVEGNFFEFTQVGIDVQVLGQYFGDPQCTSALTPPERNTFSRNTILDAISTGFHLVVFDPNLGIPRDNRFEDNVALGSFFGFFVRNGEDNTFVGNTIFSGTFPSMSDQTVGSGTNGKANLYSENLCTNPAPDHLCGNLVPTSSIVQTSPRISQSGVAFGTASYVASPYVQP